MTAREVALKALYDIETKDTFTNVALKSALAKDLTPSDRGFATEIIYGVILNKSAIDYIISKYSKIKLKKLSPWVLCILRMGVYQIYYMDKIPVSAACNEAVKLAKKYSHNAGTGFVNGVLRSFSREIETFSFPKDKSVAENLSLEYSYPLWITEKLIDEYGENTCKELYKENRKAHGVFLRTNVLKNSSDELMEILSAEGIECLKTEVENCLQVKGKINVDESKAYAEGRFSLQNISSQRAVKVLGAKSGEMIIDMCAAPGGKSCAIAEGMDNCGEVLSFDIFEHKIELIRKSADRLGIDIIKAKTGDSCVVREELVETADRVLADVPCSGLGVLHKKPDIKWNRMSDDMEELCRIQKGILETASRYVKKGGVLVYSTCTILPEENRIQIEEFLNKHNEYKKLSEEQLLTTEVGESGFYICKMMKE